MTRRPKDEASLRKAGPPKKDLMDSLQMKAWASAIRRSLNGRPEKDFVREVLQLCPPSVRRDGEPKLLLEARKGEEKKRGARGLTNRIIVRSAARMPQYADAARLFHAGFWSLLQGRATSPGDVTRTINRVLREVGLVRPTETESRKLMLILPCCDGAESARQFESAFWLWRKLNLVKRLDATTDPLHRVTLTCGLFREATMAHDFAFSRLIRQSQVRFLTAFANGLLHEQTVAEHAEVEEFLARAFDPSVLIKPGTRHHPGRDSSFVGGVILPINEFEQRRGFLRAARTGDWKIVDSRESIEHSVAFEQQICSLHDARADIPPEWLV